MIPFEPKRVSLHTHSSFSDGRDDIEAMASALREARFSEIGFTDHYADERIAKLAGRMTRRDIPAYVAACRNARALAGLEAEILDAGEVAIDQPEYEAVDYVIGGLHRLAGVQFFDDDTPIANPDQFVDELRTVLIQGIGSGRVDCIAHPTKLPNAIRVASQELLNSDWREPLIDAARQHDVAFDLNEDSQVPDVEFVIDCRDAGVRLLIGTDAHGVDDVREMTFVPTVVAAAGLKWEDFYWPRLR